jgi:BirA family biotin operon repressor/biotin-[acetyl-CoA-carboxylase] ligase
MPAPNSLSPKLPAGYRLLRLEAVDSTNAEARRRGEAGEPGPLWVWSLRQSAGRGRDGRAWQSQPGNLFASLLLGLNCSLATASQLALLTGVAAFDAIAKLLPDGAGNDLLLKWPNDVLIKGDKVAGILLESATGKAPNHCKVVIGTGINLTSHPVDLPQPATNLAAHGATPTVQTALETLAAVTDVWLARWGEGVSFPAVRRAWLDRAGPTGRPLTVHLKGKEEAEGTFAGLDSGGALRLLTGDGVERRIAAGDVFFAKP